VSDPNCSHELTETAKSDWGQPDHAAIFQPVIIITMEAAAGSFQKRRRRHGVLWRVTPISETSHRSQQEDDGARRECTQAHRSSCARLFCDQSAGRATSRSHCAGNCRAVKAPSAGKRKRRAGDCSPATMAASLRCALPATRLYPDFIETNMDRFFSCASRRNALPDQTGAMFSHLIELWECTVRIFFEYRGLGVDENLTSRWPLNITRTPIGPRVRLVFDAPATHYASSPNQTRDKSATIHCSYFSA